MATSVAAAISRSIIALRSSSQSFLTLRSAPPLRSLSKRFMSSSFQQPHPFLGQFRQAIPLSWRLNQVRFRVNQAGGSGYSPLNSGSNFSDRPPTEMAPLFPGCDYQHWLIVIDKPGGEGATKQQMIDCYIHTLAQILGSEEEAKKKIYNVSCERYFGFGCELDEETANKLESVPGVLFVLPDSYVDPEYKDYGAELFVNGEIVQRSPERQRRVEPQPQTGRDRPKYNDRTRYVRRRENMR